MILAAAMICMASEVRWDAPPRDIRLLVFTDREHCPSCRALEKTLASADASRLFDDCRITVQFIDVRSKPDLVKSWKVSLWPTMIVVEVNGGRGVRILGRRIGNSPFQELERFIRKTVDD